MSRKRKAKGKPEPPLIGVHCIGTDFYSVCGYCGWMSNVGSLYEEALTFANIHCQTKHHVNYTEDRSTGRWQRTPMRKGLTYKPNRAAPIPTKHSPKVDPTWTPPTLR